MQDEDNEVDGGDFYVTLEDVAKFKSKIRRGSSALSSCNNDDDDVWSYTNTSIATDDCRYLADFEDEDEENGASSTAIVKVSEEIYGCHTLQMNSNGVLNISNVNIACG